MFSYTSFVKLSILVVVLSSLVLCQDIPPEDLPNATTLPPSTTSYIPTTTTPEDVTPEASTESSSSTDFEPSTWSSTSVEPSSSSTQQTTVSSSERPTSPEEDWKCQCWFQSKRTFYHRRACFLCCTSYNRRSCSMVSPFFCYGY